MSSTTVLLVCTVLSELTSCCNSQVLLMFGNVFRLFATRRGVHRCYFVHRATQSGMPAPNLHASPSVLPGVVREGKDYRVSVLSLLYQGRGGELKGAAGRISTMLAGGSGDGSGRETGIALDGRLPSRKELVQLSQLCFPRAAEVRIVGGALVSLNYCGSCFMFIWGVHRLLVDFVECL